MSKALKKFFSDGGGSDRITLSYYSAEVEAKWTIDMEAPDSLQVTYDRKNLPDGVDQSFWLYLSPEDAAVIGKILTAYASAQGETL